MANSGLHGIGLLSSWHLRNVISCQCFFFIIFQTLSIERFSSGECYKHNRIFKHSTTWLPDDTHLCLFKDFFTNHSPYPLQHSLWTKRTSGFCASLPSLWPWSFIVPFRSSLAKMCAPVTAPEVRALRLTSWACRWTAAISAQSPSIETLLTPCGTNSFSSGFTLKILCFFVLQLWKTTVRQ